MCKKIYKHKFRRIIMKFYKKIILVFIIAFILNLIWEYSHFNLYFDLSGIPKHTHLFLATLMDAIIICSIFLVIIFKNQSFDWTKKTKMRDYSWIIVWGLIIASFIETHALSTGRWMYKEIMPTILGLGLSPLLQLATTGILTLFILRNFE